MGSEMYIRDSRCLARLTGNEAMLLVAEEMRQTRRFADPRDDDDDDDDARGRTSHARGWTPTASGADISAALQSRARVRNDGSEGAGRRSRAKERRFVQWLPSPRWHVTRGSEVLLDEGIGIGSGALHSRARPLHPRASDRRDRSAMTAFAILAPAHGAPRATLFLIHI